jgi:hypothetical protein
VNDHLPVVRQVLREEGSRDGSRAELVVNPVAAGEGVGQLRNGVKRQWLLRESLCGVIPAGLRVDAVDMRVSSRGRTGRPAPRG